MSRRLPPSLCLFIYLFFASFWFGFPPSRSLHPQQLLAHLRRASAQGRKRVTEDSETAPSQEKIPKKEPRLNNTLSLLLLLVGLALASLPTARELETYARLVRPAQHDRARGSNGSLSCWCVSVRPQAARKGEWGVRAKIALVSLVCLSRRRDGMHV